jgi:competence ComEA-like helix-hairpin-helix protein
MILLVWNAAATARHLADPSLPSDSAPFDLSGTPSVHADNASPADPPVSARGGPLSLRQRFLLGKRVDINRATVLEISELPGISGTVAAAVVAERKRRGAFRSHRDLLSVPGIKERRLEKILPFLAKMENN